MATILERDITMRAYARVVMDKIMAVLDEKSALVVQCGRKHSVMPGASALYTDEGYANVYPW